MQEIKTTSTLYIPDNIKTSFEFFAGIGWKEMSYIAIFAGIALMLALIYNGIAQDNFGFFRGAIMVILAIATAVSLFKKDNQNQSMIDHGRRFLRFNRQQQKFKYKHHDSFRSENM